MTRSLRSLTLLAVAAVCVLATAALALYRRARDWTFDLVLKLVPASENPKRAPAVLIVRSRALAARLLKRERPTVTDGWRMCPST